jgi:integrative and conjugative element protein (TIGR02256 family)
MLRRLSSGHVVWAVQEGVSGSFSPDLLQSLKQWQQKRFYAREAGGVLLGFIDRDTSGLLAEKATYPGNGDKRTRTSFFRGERHQKEANIWHAETKGHGTQLGLWHTHPEPRPTPSGTDYQDFHAVLSSAIYHGLGIVYIIVGTEYVGCWFGYRDNTIQEIGYFNL